MQTEDVVTGHDHEHIMRVCLQALAEDPAVGQVVLASNMLSGRPLLHAWGRVLEAVHPATTKPVVVLGHLTSGFDRDEAARLRGLGVPVLLETASGLSALASNARWHRHRASQDSGTPSSGRTDRRNIGRQLARSELNNKDRLVVQFEDGILQDIFTLGASKGRGAAQLI